MKANATGRSYRPQKRSRSKKWQPEAPFIPHSKTFRESYAFRLLSTPAKRVLEFLELEHLAHGGAENGRLAAPYSQLIAFGLSSRDIPNAIREVVALGLVARSNQTFRLGGKNIMSLYRLTYLPDCEGNKPTDDWRHVTQADIYAFKRDKKPHPD
jgi:hypothetical protein